MIYTRSTSTICIPSPKLSASLETAIIYLKNKPNEKETYKSQNWLSYIHQKQVELAKSQIDFNNPAFANPNIYTNLTTDSEKLDFIIAFSKNVYYLGDYYYKSGEWDTAEMEWLKLIYLMPKAIRRLAVLYKKEKDTEILLKYIKKAQNQYL